MNGLEKLRKCRFRYHMAGRRVDTRYRLIFFSRQAVHMFQFDGFVTKLCKSRIFFSYLFYLATEQITVYIGLVTQAMEHNKLRDGV